MIKSLVLLFILAAPFVQSDVKAEVVPAKDGVPIHYSVQGKGEPALVFVHCWSCDRHLWDNQVPVFTKDHQVVTIDLPGLGPVEFAITGEPGSSTVKVSMTGTSDGVRRPLGSVDVAPGAGVVQSATTPSFGIEVDRTAR